MTRHNNLLKILMVAWCKENELMEHEQAWYKVKWDFEYNMRKESTAKRPDIPIEYKERKVIHLVDMACPNEKNVLEKNKQKRQKYQQLAFEVRERRQKYRMEVIPIVIGCVGGAIGVMREQVRKVLTDKVCREELRTVVMEAECILKKTPSPTS